jgi:tellurite resistance protein TerC
MCTMPLAKRMGIRQRQARRAGTNGAPLQDVSRAALEVPVWAWLVFATVIAVSLAVDLVTHRGGRSLSRRHAIVWSVAWISVAALFGIFVAIEFGRETAVDFTTAYLIEKSLSVDNLFVFLVIFRRLRIVKDEQHRVLFWGILGAFVTRAIFIGAGTAVLAQWHSVVYVLGGFLIYTGIKTLRTHPDADAKESRVVTFLQRRIPFTTRTQGHHFIVLEAGRRVATPLFIALLAIEATDILFAVDSIPAVLAISNTPFIVFSSNVFAILGLRALYLVLADLVADLRYLHYGLGSILVFVGLKMLASHYVHLPHWLSLAVTVGLLVSTIVPSVISRRRRRLDDARFNAS